MEFPGTRKIDLDSYGIISNLPFTTEKKWKWNEEREELQLECSKL